MTTSLELRVFCHPDPGKRALQNPYLRLLQRALGEHGVAYFGGALRLWLGRYDVLHLHWPEALWRHRYRPIACLKALLFFGGVVAAHWRGRPIVWTAHNAVPHESASWPALETALWRWLSKRLSAVIHLGPSSQAIVASFVALATDVRHVVIPHGHYEDIVGPPAGIEASRRKSGLAGGKNVVGYFGRIKPYKGVPDLVTCFDLAGLSEHRLVVSGNFDDSALAPDERTAFQELVDGNRIQVRQQSLSDSELATFVRACDLVVLPYRNILNSGAAIFALSCGRPVCAPRLGTLPDLQAVVGPAWLYLYDPPLSPEILRAAADWAGAPRAPHEPDLKALSWSHVARAHRVLFEQVRHARP